MNCWKNMKLKLINYDAELHLFRPPPLLPFSIVSDISGEKRKNNLSTLNIKIMRMHAMHILCSQQSFRLRCLLFNKYSFKSLGTQNSFVRDEFNRLQWDIFKYQRHKIQLKLKIYGLIAQIRERRRP